MTLEGATNRAHAAFAAYDGCDYSIGIESGIIDIPDIERSLFMNIAFAVIYDGKEIHVGTNGCFEVPPKMMDLVYNQGMEMCDATHTVGLSRDRNIGREGGVIHILSKGWIDRRNYLHQAIGFALMPFLNPELYP